LTLTGIIGVFKRVAAQRRNRRLQIKPGIKLEIKLEEKAGEPSTVDVERALLLRDFLCTRAVQ
jgi:hypothetical protein